MLRNLPCNLARKVAARGKWGQCFAWTNMFLSCLEAVLAGSGTLIVWSSIHIPLILSWSLQAADSLMAFKCLTRNHMILIGWSSAQVEEEERRALISWVAATRAHWVVDHWNTQKSNPGQSSSIASIATDLFPEGSKRKKQEILKEALEKTVSTRCLCSLTRKTKPSQSESHNNVTSSQTHWTCDLPPKVQFSFS